jgi:hypothetical protein
MINVKRKKVLILTSNLKLSLQRGGHWEGWSEWGMKAYGTLYSYDTFCSKLQAKIINFLFFIIIIFFWHIEAGLGV